MAHRVRRHRFERSRRIRAQNQEAFHRIFDTPRWAAFAGRAINDTLRVALDWQSPKGRRRSRNHRQRQQSEKYAWPPAE